MPLRVRTSSARPAASEPVEHLLGALVLPGHDRGQWPAGIRVPGQHRLALMVEPAGRRRPIGFGKKLADGIDDRRQHLGGVLLDPARARVREPLLAACLGQRPELGVVQHGFDRGGSLVDPEEQRHAVTSARYSAVRRHQGRSRRGTGPPWGAASGPSGTPSEATIR